MKPETTTTAKPLHSLLIVYLGPPLLAVAALLIIMSWLHAEQSDPRPVATIGVKKGGRIGSETSMFR
ncbi:hypothetical protein FHX08_000840 [Rhizobium sp. BK529]|uniref:hypothetical protein n=1 Tax=unclassified Rhizobium TaxID=2613769 RepID=UPI001046C3C5|nr:MULTISPECIES: hypothetical protein [unclassified Rhizobium]MBB3590496.1 hypothetical protein [Rhizobium sp. BK529]TCS05185.1 hypothetical protein EV281_103867 [Rhizobium sp. BK418]